MFSIRKILLTRKFFLLLCLVAVSPTSIEAAAIKAQQDKPKIQEKKSAYAVVSPTSIEPAAIKAQQDKPKIQEKKSTYTYEHGKGILDQDKKLLAKELLKSMISEQTPAIERALITLCKNVIKPNRKPVVFVLGPTGAGKSSLIGFLQGCDSGYDKRKDKAKIMEDTKPPGLAIPEIGDQDFESTTKGSHVYMHNNDAAKFCFCDSEGFSGTAAERSLPELYVAMYDPYFVIQANEVHGIVLVLEHKIGTERCLKLKKTITYICNHFLQQKLEDLKKSFLIAVTKAVNCDDQDRFKANLINTIQATNKEFYSYQKPEPMVQKSKLFFDLFLRSPVPQKDVEDFDKYIIDTSMIVFVNNCGKPILSSALDIDDSSKRKAVYQKCEEDLRRENRDFLLARIAGFTGIPSKAFSTHDAKLLKEHVHRIAQHLDNTLLVEGRKEYYRYKVLKAAKDAKLKQKIIDIIEADKAYLKAKISAYNGLTSIFFETYKKPNPYESYSVTEAAKQDMNTAFSTIKNQETDNAVNVTSVYAGTATTLVSAPEVGPVAPVVGAIAGGITYIGMKADQYVLASGAAFVIGVCSFFGRGVDYLYNGYLVKTFEYETEELISEIRCACTNGYFTIGVPNAKNLKQGFCEKQNDNRGLILVSKGKDGNKGGVLLSKITIRYVTEYGGSADVSVNLLGLKKEHSSLKGTQEEEYIKIIDEEIDTLDKIITPTSKQQAPEQIEKSWHQLSAKLLSPNLKAAEGEDTLCPCPQETITMLKHCLKYLFVTKEDFYVEKVKDCVRHWDVMFEDSVSQAYDDEDDEKSKN